MAILSTFQFSSLSTSNFVLRMPTTRSQAPRGRTRAQNVSNQPRSPTKRAPVRRKPTQRSQEEEDRVSSDEEQDTESTQGTTTNTKKVAANKPSIPRPTPRPKPAKGKAAAEETSSDGVSLDATFVSSRAGWGRNLDAPGRHNPPPPPQHEGTPPPPSPQCDNTPPPPPPPPQHETTPPPPSPQRENTPPPPPPQPSPQGDDTPPPPERSRSRTPSDGNATEDDYAETAERERRDRVNAPRYRRPPSEEELDAEDDRDMEDEAIPEEPTPRPRKKGKGKGKARADDDDSHKRGPLPDAAKDALNVIKDDMHRAVAEVARKYNKPIETCFAFIGHGKAAPRYEPNGWNAFQIQYNADHEKPSGMTSAEWTQHVSEEFKKEMVEKCGDEVDNPKRRAEEQQEYKDWYRGVISKNPEHIKEKGQLKLSVVRASEELTRLGVQLRESYGVHAFGYVIQTQLDEFRMSHSCMWGSTEAVEKAKIQYPDSFNGQVTKFEGMIRLQESGEDTNPADQLFPTRKPKENEDKRDAKRREFSEGLRHDIRKILYTRAHGTKSVEDFNLAKMPYTKWADFAFENQLCLVEWPSKAKTPERGFVLKKDIPPDALSKCVLQRWKAEEDRSVEYTRIISWTTERRLMERDDPDYASLPVVINDNGKTVLRVMDSDKYRELMRKKSGKGKRKKSKYPRKYPKNARDSDSEDASEDEDKDEDEDEDEDEARPPSKKSRHERPPSRSPSPPLLRAQERFRQPQARRYRSRSVIDLEGDERARSPIVDRRRSRSPVARQSSHVPSRGRSPSVHAPPPPPPPSIPAQPAPMDIALFQQFQQFLAFQGSQAGPSNLNNYNQYDRR
ncbi:hypothetical protein H0H93_004158 [Arthromyces matolae]|nr:hypothetical protein H0H93_004158 [Arthromyces matolae]